MRKIRGIITLVTIILVCSIIFFRKDSVDISSTKIIRVYQYDSGEEEILKFDEEYTEINEIISLIEFNSNDFNNANINEPLLAYQLKFYNEAGEFLCEYTVYNIEKRKELVRYLNTLFPPIN